MDPIFSIILMSIGSICAASFYVPIRKNKGWSWESYWLVQDIFSWVIVPLFFALITMLSGILGNIIEQASANSKVMAVFYGALWGIKGLTFGLTAGEPLRQVILVNGVNPLFAKNTVIMFVTFVVLVSGLIIMVFSTFVIKLNIKLKKIYNHVQRKDLAGLCQCKGTVCRTWCGYR